MSGTSHPYCAFAVTVLTSMMESGCSDADLSSKNDFMSIGRFNYEETDHTSNIMNINPFAPHSMNGLN